jgi:hypothetical protein
LFRISIKSGEARQAIKKLDKTTDYVVKVVAFSGQVMRWDEDAYWGNTVRTGVDCD